MTKQKFIFGSSPINNYMSTVAADAETYQKTVQI